MRTRLAVWLGGAMACALLAGAVAIAGEGEARPAHNVERLKDDRPAGPTASDLLLLGTDKGTETLATGEGERSLDLPEGIVIPGTTRLFSSAMSRSSTTLAVTDLASGKTTRGSRFAGSLVTSVVSGSGRYAALTSPRREGATPWLPDGRRETRIVIASIAGGRDRSFELQGNIEPEAFSTDDRTLFLIEFMPAMAPTHYAVRRLNLASGRVAPIARLKLSAPRVMRGTGRMQELAPDREELYTLYTQQGPNYAHGTPESSDPDTVHAFVHVLSLRDRWAHCIDLPAPFGTGRATASALAQTPDGGLLYVTDWTNGVVAKIDPSNLRVLEVMEAPFGGADDQTFADATEEVVYVAGESTVLALDAGTMRQIGRWRAPAEIEGLKAAPSGDAIYVAVGSRVVKLDADLKSQTRSWRTRGITGILDAFTAEGVAS